MKRNKFVSLALLGLIGSPTLVAAQDDMDDVLGFFEEEKESIEIDTSNLETQPTAWGWVNTGSLSLSAAWNYEDHKSSFGTDYQGLSKFRTRVNLQSDNQLNEQWRIRLAAYAWYDAAYTINGRDEYSDQVLEEMETEIETQEVFAEGKLNEHWDLKMGRQIVIWGYSENVRVIDVLNPLDNLEPGLADIEDIRLPVTMVKADYYFSDWNLSLIVVPEIRFSKNPPPGSDYFYAADFSGQPLILEEDLPRDFEHQNWGLALSGTVGKWDMSLNAARFWRDNPVLDISNVDYSQLGSNPNEFNDNAFLRHSRVNMLGASTQTTAGSWLFKTEIAYFDGYEFLGTNPVTIPGFGTLPLPTESFERDQVDVLVGVEYFGISNTTVSLDLVNRTILDYEDSIEASGVDEVELEVAFRVTRSMMRERLDLTFLTINFDNGDDGSITRFDAQYEISDGLNATLGILVYGEGENDPLASFADNDRLFGEIKWSF